MSKARLGTMMAWDLKGLGRQYVGRAVLLSLLLVCVLATVLGIGHQRQLDRRHGDALDAAAQARTALLERLNGPEANAVLPISARLHLLLPPAALAALAGGRSLLDPQTGTGTAFTQQQNLFRDYQFDSPDALAGGLFDLSFVIVVLLPLWVIALALGVSAEDRASGVDRLLAAHGVGPVRWWWARSLLRCAVLLLPPLLATLVLLAASTGADWLWHGSGVLVLTTGYLAFWWNLSSWVSSRPGNPGRPLLVLLSCWALLVLLVPALVGSLTRQWHPPPSRLALIAQARAAEIAGHARSTELLGTYSHDHPELDASATANLPEWARTGFLVARAVDAQTAALLEQFDAALAAQFEAVSRWQYASPALLLQQSLVRLAGTDERTALAFRRQARASFQQFRERIGALTLAGQPLTPALLDSLPRFDWQPPQRHWLALAGGPALLLWGLAGLLAVTTRRALLMLRAPA